MDFSRVRAGCVDLDFQRMALALALRAAVEMIAPLADVKSVRLESELDTSADPVSGDSACLQQLFIDIPSNAVKFSPEGGLVRVRVARCGDRAEVSMSDRVRGIRPDFLPYASTPSGRRRAGL